MTETDRHIHRGREIKRERKTETEGEETVTERVIERERETTRSESEKERERVARNTNTYSPETAGSSRNRPASGMARKSVCGASSECT